MDRNLGTEGRERTLRLFGLREIAAGAIILAQKEPGAASVWSRVGGDVMDLLLLGKALDEQRNRTKRERLEVATVTVATITALDVVCAWQLRRRSKNEPAQEDATRVETSITLHRTAEEWYQLWRDPQTLPQVMGHFATVTAQANGDAHWVVSGPVKTSLQWNSQIVQDESNHLLRWYSTQGAKIPNGGSITFSPATGGRG